MSGAYTGEARQVDQFIWNHPDMLITYSAGNEGVDANSDGVVDQFSLGTPASAKNALTVGASESYRLTGGLNPGGPCSTYFNCFDGGSGPPVFRVAPISADRVSNNANGLAAFSSRGPARDGRIKPDVVAPGTNILSTHSQHPSASVGWDVGPDQWYNYEGGTSMSTPLTAGTAVLVREFYARQGLSASAALVKATLINGAADLTPGQYGTGATQEVIRRPDPAQGWGRVDLAQSLMPSAPLATWFDDHRAGLTTGQSITYTNVFTVGGQTGPLRATLVWNDYPGSLISQRALVNDLNLEVIGPDGSHYYGNDRSGDGTLDGDIDTLNNVEGVDLSAALPGSYTVIVHGSNVPQGPQPYALRLLGPRSGVSITPPAPSRTVIAGRTATYDLAITNSSGATQSFDLAVSGNTWPTTPANSSTGPLNPGQSVTVTLTVQVPAGQVGTDHATLTASAQGNPALRASAVLTTQALAEYVELQPAAQSKSDAPGNTVIYPLTLRNSTGAARSFTLSLASGWPAEVRDASNQIISATAQLAPDASATLRVLVTIPDRTLIGKFADTTLVAQAADQPSLSATAQLHTTAAVGWQEQPTLTNRAAESTLISNGATLHLLGGYGDFFTALNQHEIFDPATETWSAGTPMSATPASPSGLLTSADGCAIGTKLFVPGGRFNVSTYDGTTRIYDTANDFWGAGRLVTTASGTAKPVRYKAICDPSFGTQGAVYLIGGADRGAGLASLTGLYRYTVSSNTWVALASMTTPRQLAYAGLINGKIYVFGGQTSIANSSAVSSAEVYTIATNTWAPGTALPAPLSGGGSGVINGKLYLFGGHGTDNAAQGITYEFNPATAQWRTLPTINHPRYYLAGAALGSALYAAGGDATGNTFFERLSLGTPSTLNITATLRAPAVASRGAQLGYTLTITPTGDYTATTALATSALPASLNFSGGLTASTGSATYDAATRTVHWAGPLVPGTPVVIQFSATVTGAAPLGEPLVLSATVNDGEARIGSEFTVAATTLISGPSLRQTTKIVEPPSAGFGTVVTYTLNLVNSGTQSTTAQLSDPLPAGLTFGGFVNSDGGRATYSAGTNTVQWSGPLAPTVNSYSLTPTPYAWTEISATGTRLTAGAWTAVAGTRGRRRGLRRRAAAVVVPVLRRALPHGVCRRQRPDRLQPLHRVLQRPGRRPDDPQPGGAKSSHRRAPHRPRPGGDCAGQRPGLHPVRRRQRPLYHRVQGCQNALDHQSD